MTWIAPKGLPEDVMTAEALAAATRAYEANLDIRRDLREADGGDAMEPTKRELGTWAGGREMAQAICEIVGLNPDFTRDVRIVCKAPGVVLIKSTQYVTKGEAAAILKVLRAATWEETKD
ncbi:MAG: hypothetical protein Q7O66_06725 [Dehalococcoidia bacterium]|nr:hypothetical protein [Dehalococcoidia bacterium]